jgi:hypothetical protein
VPGEHDNDVVPAPGSRDVLQQNEFDEKGFRGQKIGLSPVVHVQGLHNTTDLGLLRSMPGRMSSHSFTPGTDGEARPATPDVAAVT